MKFLKTKGVLIIVVAALTACAGIKMKDAAEPQIISTPNPDQGSVVFLRPSSSAGGVQAAVYDITDSNSRFIGILYTHKKIAYEALPGRRRFMVVSEAADFLDVDLVAGHPSFVLVTPRVGVWRARFSLRHTSQADARFEEWSGRCSWVENTPSSAMWAKKNMKSVEDKKRKYLEQWVRKSEQPDPDSEASQD